MIGRLLEKAWDLLFNWDVFFGVGVKRREPLPEPYHYDPDECVQDAETYVKQAYAPVLEAAPPGKMWTTINGRPTLVDIVHKEPGLVYWRYTREGQKLLPEIVHANEAGGLPPSYWLRKNCGRCWYCDLQTRLLYARLEPWGA